MIQDLYPQDFACLSQTLGYPYVLLPLVDVLAVPHKAPSTKGFLEGFLNNFCGK
jgi:hypothetical protein